VETEAYIIGDAASHAYRGMTPRTRSMFLERGRAYVYLSYGVSRMLNVSSEAAGIGAGVLIRALEPLEGNRDDAAQSSNRDACGTWREALDGWPRRCRSGRGPTGWTCARPGRCGWAQDDHEPGDIGPNNIGCASASAFPRTRSGRCGSMFGAVPSSAVKRHV
jgi:DNA-3-methyladenine glycosylase